MFAKKSESQETKWKSNNLFMGLRIHIPKSKKQDECPNISNKKTILCEKTGLHLFK